MLHFVAFCCSFVYLVILVFIVVHIDVDVERIFFKCYMNLSVFRHGCWTWALKLETPGCRPTRGSQASVQLKNCDHPPCYVIMLVIGVVLDSFCIMYHVNVLLLEL